MTSVRAWRWRASELGDDGSDEAEMTSVTKRRLRVWQSRDDECEEVVYTSKLERRWRKGRRGDDECEAVVDTSKHERRWRKRVLWDDVELCGKFMSETPLGVWVRCRWVYGWDTNTCMGEIPQQLWARRRGAAELISTNPQPSPCVMWNKTGWKSVIIKVDSWQQRRLWLMWIVNIANFTLKLMSGQLIAELTLSLSTNYHFSTIFLCLMTGKN